MQRASAPCSPASGIHIVVPITWDFQPGVLIVKTIDVYTNDELVQAVEEIMKDSRFSSLLTVVFDARLSAAPLKKEDIEWRVNSLADHLWRRGFGRRMAFVVPPDKPARYGVGRMLQMLTESKGFEIELFRELGDAMKWALETREVERNDNSPP